jgi:hypothetical protein
MRELNTQLVYLDEAMFTLSAFTSKVWSHKRDRIRINDSNLIVTTLAVIAAISDEHVLIDYIVHPNAINSELFVAFTTRSLRNSEVETFRFSWIT